MIAAGRWPAGVGRWPAGVGQPAPPDLQRAGRPRPSAPSARAVNTSGGPVPKRAPYSCSVITSSPVLAHPEQRTMLPILNPPLSPGAPALYPSDRAGPFHNERPVN